MVKPLPTRPSAAARKQIQQCLAVVCAHLS
jgi:hypothetical protein